MWIDQRGSEVLDLPECLWLLANEATHHGFGRLAVARQGAPVVAPVNFSYADHQILVQVGEGYLWDHARDQPVAFEVDHLDPERGHAWSVLVRGLAAELGGVAGRATAALPCPMVPHPGSRVLGIRPDAVTGRRFLVSASGRAAAGAVGAAKEGGP